MESCCCPPHPPHPPLTGSAVGPTMTIDGAFMRGGGRWLTLDELKRFANEDELVGPVLDVVFRVEKMVRVGMINLDRDLIALPPA